MIVSTESIWNNMDGLKLAVIAVNGNNNFLKDGKEAKMRGLNLSIFVQDHISP